MKEKITASLIENRGSDSHRSLRSKSGLEAAALYWKPGVIFLINRTADKIR